MPQNERTSIFKKSLIDFLRILLMSGAIFLILPLKFIGPEFVNCTTSKDCAFTKTTQWRWFGAYHILAEPVSGNDQAVHNNKYTLTSDAQLLMASVGTLVIVSGVYALFIKLKSKSTYEASGGR